MRRPGTNGPKHNQNILYIDTLISHWEIIEKCKNKTIYLINVDTFSDIMFYVGLNRQASLHDILQLIAN